MTRLDLDFVRGQFPAFAEPSLAGFAHFDNAGGSYACRQTIEWLTRCYRQTKLQPYGASVPSRAAGEQMDAARRRLAAWLNVGTEELHFGPSTSQNSYVLAHAFRERLQPGDEVIVTGQDHEANVGAWRRLAESGIRVLEWRIDPDSAELGTSALESLLSARTRLVAFTHCSNVLASVHPVRQWCDLVHAAGAWAVVDGVSHAPHGLPDVAALGADVYLFSLYKVYGPHLGAMYVRRELNEWLPNQGHFFNATRPGHRLTPAGPDHAQIVAVNGVVDYLDALADHHGIPAEAAAERTAAVGRLLHDTESELLQPVLDRLAEDPRFRLLGRRRADERAPTVAFTIAGQRPVDVAKSLAASGLGVGAGHFYAYRLIESLGIIPDDGVVRASFVHYTSADEVDRLIAALDAL